MSHQGIAVLLYYNDFKQLGELEPNRLEVIIGVAITVARFILPCGHAPWTQSDIQSLG